MKDVFKIVLLALFFLLVYRYKENITEYIVDNFISDKFKQVVINNEYSLDYDFRYIEKTDDYMVKNKQQLLNVFYTYLDSGADEFYFYCDYDECTKDFNEMNEKNIFSNINNYVHPYNTYNNLYITINSWDKISIIIDKSYSSQEIKTINTKINEITDKIITDNMSNKEKIKVFHDYIINNTIYDIEYLNDNINDLSNPSHRASGPLLYKKALCGGYSHVMAIFLNKLKIPNYRISSDTHIWNFVYINNNWYHLDLTWDDPITTDKSNVLLHNFFMIDSERLEQLNTGKHTFDKNVFIETNLEY